MATIKNAIDIILQAASPRLEAVLLPSNVNVDWTANVTGIYKPEDDATYGATFDATGSSFRAYALTFLGNASVSMSTPDADLLRYTLTGNDQVTGTVAKLITAIELQAGTYISVSAMLGCTIVTDTATLELRQANGTVISSLAHTGLPAHETNAGFTLAIATQIYFCLLGGSSTSNALIYGIQIK